MASYLLLALVIAVAIAPLLWVAWGATVAWLGRRAQRHPERWPRIERRETRPWRLRLPWFRAQARWLESTGYRSIGWVDEVYGAPHTIAREVYWSDDAHSFASIFSVLVKPRVFFYGWAGSMLVRTIPAARERGLGGDHFLDQGDADRERQVLAHHALLARERRHRGPDRAGGTVPAFVEILREITSRTDPSAGTPFVFGELEPLEGDVVVRIGAELTTRDELCRAVIEGLSLSGLEIRGVPVEEALVSWDALAQVLTAWQAHDGRTVLWHERYPGVTEEPERYLELLTDVVHQHDSLVVVFATELH